MVKNSDYLRELPRLPLHTEDWDGTGAQQPVIFEEVFAEQAAPVSPLRASFPSAPVVATAGTTATATAGQSPQSSSNSNSNSSSSTSVTISLSSSTTGVKTAASAVDGKSPAAARPVNTPSQKSSPSTTTTGAEQSHSSPPGSPAAGAGGTGSNQSAAAVETVSCASQVPLSRAVLSTMRAQRSSTSSISSLGPSKKYTMQKGESRAKQAETRVSGLTGYRKITEVPDGFGTTLLTELGVPHVISFSLASLYSYSHLYAFAILLILLVLLGTLKSVQAQAADANSIGSARPDRRSTANSSVRSEGSSSSNHSDSVAALRQQQQPRTFSEPVSSSSPPETLKSGATERDGRLSIVGSVLGTDETDSPPSLRPLSSAASTLLVFNPELPPAAAEAAVEQLFSKNARGARRMMDLKLGRLQKRASQTNLMRIGAAGSMPDLTLAFADIELRSSGNAANDTHSLASHRQSAYISPTYLVRARNKSVIATSSAHRAIAYSTMDLTQLALPDAPANAVKQNSSELVNAPLPSNSTSTGYSQTSESAQANSTNHTAGDKGKESAPSSPADSPLHSSATATGSLKSDQRSGSACALAIGGGSSVPGILLRRSNSPSSLLGDMAGQSQNQSPENGKDGGGGSSTHLRRIGVLTSPNSASDLRLRSDSFGAERRSPSLSNPVQQNIIRCVRPLR